MSARIEVQVMTKNSDDSLSAGINKTVQLYSGDNPTVPGDTPVGTFTENNNDGLYYYDVLDSGLYTVVVDGTIQNALKGFKVDANEGQFKRTTGDATVLQLTNEDDETTYIWPNDTQNGVVVDSSLPT